MEEQTAKKRKTGIGQYRGVLWIAPAFVLLLVFSYYPPVYAIIQSFTDWNGTTAHFIGFDNFARLFRDELFYRSCGNMLFLMITCMVIGNVCTIILAEVLFNLRSARANAVYRFLFVLPALVPGIVTIMLWGKVILTGQPNGLVNTILGKFGLLPCAWFDGENTVLLAIVVYGFPWVGGTSFLIYLAGLNNIPDSVIEASKLDGVSAFGRIFKIDLPLIMGQIKYFIVMGIIGGIQGYTIQYAITNGGPGLKYASMVPGYYMYKAAMNDSEYGYSCAVGLVLFLVILAVTLINNKVIKTEDY